MNKYDRRKTRELQIEDTKYFTFSYNEGKVDEYFGVYIKRKDDIDVEVSKNEKGLVRLTIDGVRTAFKPSFIYYSMRRNSDHYITRCNLSRIGLPKYEVDNIGRIYHIDRPEKELKRYGMYYWFKALAININGPKAYIQMTLLDDTGIFFPEEQIVVCSELSVKWSISQLSRIKITKTRYMTFGVEFVGKVVDKLIRFKSGNGYVVKYLLLDNKPYLSPTLKIVPDFVRYDLLEADCGFLTSKEQVKYHKFDAHRDYDLYGGLGFILKRISWDVDLERKVDKMIVLDEILRGVPKLRNLPDNIQYREDINGITSGSVYNTYR